MRYFHSGCLGDVIYAIPSMRSMGLGGILFGDRPWTKPIVSRLPSIKRLLESQECILFAEIHQGQKIDVDFSTFRRGGLIYGDTIADRQARWTRVVIDLSKPWLAVEPDPCSADKIVVNRCPRWEGWFFPWRQIVQVFQDDLLFVGLPEEHRAFCEEFGAIRYCPIHDLHDAARLIAGCEMFIGNQSSCNAIAEGLHKRKVLEVCLYAPDCLYARPGALYCADGSLEFEACGKAFQSDAVKFIPRKSSAVDWDKPALIERVKNVMREKGCILPA